MYIIDGGCFEDSNSTYHHFLSWVAFSIFRQYIFNPSPMFTHSSQIWSDAMGKWKISHIFFDILKCTCHVKLSKIVPARGERNSPLKKLLFVESGRFMGHRSEFECTASCSETVFYLCWCVCVYLHTRHWNVSALPISNPFNSESDQYHDQSRSQAGLCTRSVLVRWEKYSSKSGYI